MLQDFLGAGHHAAQAAVEADVLFLRHGELHVLHHLSGGKLGDQEFSVVKAGKGFGRERPQGNGPDQAGFNAFLPGQLNRAQGDPRHAAVGHQDDLGVFDVVAFPALLIFFDFIEFLLKPEVVGFPLRRAVTAGGIDMGLAPRAAPQGPGEIRGWRLFARQFHALPHFRQKGVA